MFSSCPLSLHWGLCSRNSAMKACATISLSLIYRIYTRATYSLTMTGMASVPSTSPTGLVARASTN